MVQHILPGNPPVSVTLRRSARARRISLRVSRIDGRVTLTLPRGVSENEALSFAGEKADWLRDNLSRRPEDVVVAPGVDLPFEGVAHRIDAGTGRAVVQRAGILAVPGAPEDCGARLAGFLKARARDRLASACDDYAARLGRRYSRLTLRDTRSRWGSCTSEGGLMFSWRLILAPPEVLSYVAAHEVAHLAEMNHSPAFWSAVQAIHGDYRAPRRWLREEGGALHRYKFGL